MQKKILHPVFEYAEPESSSLGDTAIDVAQNVIKLLLVHLGTLLYASLKRVTNLEFK